MTIINILEDGTVFPPLRKQDLIIRIQQGKVCLGQLDRQRFLSGAEDYLREPLNAADMKADVLAYITAEMPGLFGKSEAVHIICPGIISLKATWNNDPVQNLIIQQENPVSAKRNY